MLSSFAEILYHNMILPSNPNKYSKQNILIINQNIFLPGLIYNKKKDMQMKTRIKELRLEKKLTQRALADRLCTNQTTLSKIENGTCTPDALLLIDLSQFFHVSTDYILFLSEERVSADFLLADNMCNLKKYQRLISLYQKMNYKQQGDCYAFLSSMLGVNGEY